jgi:hypothetical protein
MTVTRASRYMALWVCLLIAGCIPGEPEGVDKAGERLVRSLPQLFPDQILAIEFQYHPPLDPPMLFIDLSPSMDPDEQRRFLCDKVMPQVKEVNRAIGATVSYGWSNTDCDDS